MKVKALISFSGIISMQIGETRDIDNKEIVEDLKQAGYVKIVKDLKNTGYVKIVKRVDNIEEKNVNSEVTNDDKEVVTDEN